MEVAKAPGTAVLVVGHVTKEGCAGGPRALEHLVDCVLLFEGERERTLPHAARAQEPLRPDERGRRVRDAPGGLDRGRRTLRALRRRGDRGARLVRAVRRWRARGRCSSRCRRSSRLTEIVPPRRIANGIDRNRLALVLAVLGRHAGASLSTADVFVNVAGGVRVDEPGADLAVALALASRPAASRFAAWQPRACFGEVGLTGELRHVAHPERRVAEARSSDSGR